MSTVNRDKLPSLALVLLTVLALSVTAATINSTVGGPESQEGIVFNPGDQQGGNPNGNFGGNGATGGGNATQQSEGVTFSVCIEFLQQPVAILGIVAIIALLFYGIARRWNPAAAALAGTGILPIVLAAYFLLTNCASRFSQGVNKGGPGNINPAMGGGAIDPPTIPPALIAIVLFGVVGIASVMLYSITGSDETYEELDEEPEDDPEEVDFAAAAGRAADRIEQHSVGVDNAVYRAWLEMTNLLDIPNPKSSTPMDFAEAAIAFGLAEDDVMELTDLFNEVRYGHMDAESREERALEILRHIESEYGEDMTDDTESGGEE